MCTRLTMRLHMTKRRITRDAPVTHIYICASLDSSGLFFQTSTLLSERYNLYCKLISRTVKFMVLYVFGRYYVCKHICYSGERKRGVRKGGIGQVNRNTQQTNTNKLDFPIPPFLIPPFPISQVTYQCLCGAGAALKSKPESAEEFGLQSRPDNNVYVYIYIYIYIYIHTYVYYIIIYVTK